MRWLIVYYNVKPAQNLKVYNLDILDMKDYPVKEYKDEVLSELEDYEFGIKRKGVPSDAVLCHNNRRMMIVVTDTLKEALYIFYQKALS